MTEDDIKAKLTPAEYAVLRNKGTEAPFSGTLAAKDEHGNYVCKVCEQPLFAAGAKFDSGTGWPSFDQAIPGAIDEVADDTHGMRRVETVCSKCKSHLGHVFNDGPTETGKRYCINSVCLS